VGRFWTVRSWRLVDWGFISMGCFVLVDFFLLVVVVVMAVFVVVVVIMMAVVVVVMVSP